MALLDSAQSSIDESLIGMINESQILSLNKSLSSSKAATRTVEWDT